jgi:hypothetical protein
MATNTTTERIIAAVEGGSAAQSAFERGEGAGREGLLLLTGDNDAATATTATATAPATTAASLHLSPPPSCPTTSLPVADATPAVQAAAAGGGASGDGGRAPPLLSSIPRAGGGRREGKRGRYSCLRRSSRDRNVRNRWKEGTTTPRLASSLTPAALRYLSPPLLSAFLVALFRLPS